MRDRAQRCGLWFLCTGLVAGALACTPAQSPSKPTVSLRLRTPPQATPPGATVVIDEETVGTFDFVAARGVALPVGTHHVTVKATGYFPWDHTVEAPAGSAPIYLDVALMPIPD
jgi:hypothetical protein